MKTTYNTSIVLALASLVACQFSVASPIPETSIPENVDWFAHLDADQMRSTSVGGYLFDQLVNIDPLKNNEQLPVNPVLLINGIKSITTFGTIPHHQAENKGDVDVVAIINGTPELMQIFQGLLSGFQLEKPEAIEEIIEGDYTILHLVEQGISGVFISDEQIAVSKSRESMAKFLAVHSGDQQHVRFGEKFPVPDYIDGMGVYLGVYVEGLGDFKELPAQARILQLTQAVAVQIGETSDNLHLLASLVTDKPETASQVQDVLNGLIAVMVLTQNGHPDVATLVNSADVSQQNSAVTLKIDYPAASAQKWISVLVDKIGQEMTEEVAETEASISEGGTEEIEPIRETEPLG